MTIATVSPKYQVVIHKDVRIELVPVEPISSFRGRFPGLPPFEGEPDRL